MRTWSVCAPLNHERRRQTCSRRGHTNEQIIYALQQMEGGKKVADVCREAGVSEATFYVWKKRYGGLGVSELRELRQLRDENRKLKSTHKSPFS